MLDPSQPAPLLRVSALRRTFDVTPASLVRLMSNGSRRLIHAVDGVDFSVSRGETFSLVGESGCGKTTIARLVAGLDTPSTGSVEVTAAAGVTRPRIQMIFQDPFASLDPRWRVGDTIAEPIRFHRLRPRRQVPARVAELLGKVGLSPQDAGKFPNQFSGGQRQRIAIARALAAEPALLVCDEPTSALDVSIQAQILNLLKDLQRDLGLTCLFISHDLAVVRFIAKTTGVMYLGRLVESGPTRTVFAGARHPYTRMLLDAIPDMAMSGRRRAPVGGEVPSPLDPPPGCAFHPRCPLANERCRREVPRALPSGASVVACHAVEEGRQSA